MYEHDPLTEQIIQAGIEVHRALGPGLLESVYEEARLDPVHRAQLLAYLRVTKLRVGLLMNFNTAVLKDGLKRMAL